MSTMVTCLFYPLLFKYCIVCIILTQVNFICIAPIHNETVLFHIHVECGLDHCLQCTKEISLFFFVITIDVVRHTRDCLTQNNIQHKQRLPVHKRKTTYCHIPHVFSVKGGNKTCVTHNSNKTDKIFCSHAIPNAEVVPPRADVQ